MKLVLYLFLFHSILVISRCFSTQGRNIKLSRKKRWEFQTFSVREGLRRKKEITKLHSSADQKGMDVVYSISGVGVGSLFEVDGKTGKLYAIAQLDREAKSYYELQVSAKDKHGNNIEPPSDIRIEVEDINDNAPVFLSKLQHANVQENSSPGTLVTTVRAFDRDDPKEPYGEIEYSLVQNDLNDDQNMFRIDRETGKVYTVTYGLDRTTKHVYHLVVKAIDDPGSLLSNEAYMNLTISITDVNDNPPIFTQSEYKPSPVPEDAEIGFTVVRLSTTDRDALQDNKMNKYSIVDDGRKDSSYFDVETKGNIAIVKVKKALDFETIPTHKIKVKAENLNPDENGSLLSGYCDVIIRVRDVNEVPMFDESSYTFQDKKQH